MIIYVKGVIFPSSILCVLLVLFSCTLKPDEILRAYVEANNAHDIDKVMSLFTDDIRFENVGVWVKQGKEEVRTIAEWDATTHIHMTISDITVMGDTVTFRLIETNDWLKSAGVDEWHWVARVITKNGLIKEIKATLTEESAKIFIPVYQSIIQWMSTERPQELPELMPGGEFVYGAEVAKKWLDMLNEWREATECNK